MSKIKQYLFIKIFKKVFKLKEKMLNRFVCKECHFFYPPSCCVKAGRSFKTKPEYRACSEFYPRFCP